MVSLRNGWLVSWAWNTLRRFSQMFRLTRTLGRYAPLILAPAKSFSLEPCPYGHVQEDLEMGTEISDVQTKSV